MREPITFTIHIWLDLILNNLSILSGLIVSIILGWSMIKYSKLVNRISLRLTFGIAIVDIFKAMYIILYTTNQNTGLGCVVISFFLHWLTTVYILLNKIILFNV